MNGLLQDSNDESAEVSARSRIEAYATLVAVCDILGFKNLLRDHKATDIAVEMQQHLGRCIHNALYQTEVTQPLINIEDMQKNPDVGVVLFSDTLLIYGKHGDYSAIDAVIKVVAWLIFRTLFHSRFRFRAGISYGLLCADIRSSVYLGPAVVAAHEIERRQEWIGAAVDENTSEYLQRRTYNSSFEKPSLDPPLVSYPIPFSDSTSKKLLAVNWTFITQPDLVIKPPSEDYLNTLCPAEGQKLIRKYNNTQKFFDEVSMYGRHRRSAR